MAFHRVKSYLLFYLANTNYHKKEYNTSVLYMGRPSLLSARSVYYVTPPHHVNTLSDKQEMRILRLIDVILI